MENGAFEAAVSQPLLTTSLEKQHNDDDDDDQEFDNKEEAEENHKPVTSIVSAYKLLTPSVKVRLTSLRRRFNISNGSCI